MNTFLGFVKRTAATVVAVVVVSVAHAQTSPTVPTATDLSSGISTMGGVAGGAAALGLSIWLYRKVKAKAGQAIG